MMFRLLFFRLSRRRAVSTIIGGLIILSVILTALGTMVFVSKQYDQYQQTANDMAQYQDQVQSENLVANSPGLTLVASAAISGWGSGCTSTYNCYNMSISNLGGIGVQIVRIYVTSTLSGCTTLCILNPSSAITPYGFNRANRFLNPGEVNHAVLLALPFAVNLPSISASLNTISIVTSRGNVFSFQWPFQIQIGGQSQSAFSAGIVNIAYQDISGTGSGYDSSHDYSNATGHTPATTYCHNEPRQPYPAGANYAEKLTGITGVGVTGNTLYFVNPWITQLIFNSAQTSPTIVNKTMFYIYVNITNTGNTNYTIAGGTLDLTWYGSNHIGGKLIGIYSGKAPGRFSMIGSGQTFVPGQSFYAIFRVVEVSLGTGSTWPPSPAAPVMFWGSASLTDSTKDTTFIAGVGLSSGVWIRISCSGS